MVGERELGMGGIRARSEGQSSSYREGVLRLSVTNNRQPEHTRPIGILDTDNKAIAPFTRFFLSHELCD